LRNGRGAETRFSSAFNENDQRLSRTRNPDQHRASEGLQDDMKALKVYFAYLKGFVAKKPIQKIK
jgi:hypothetical protein